MLQGGGNMPAYGKTLSQTEVTALVRFLELLMPAHQPGVVDASQQKQKAQNAAPQIAPIPSELQPFLFNRNISTMTIFALLLAALICLGVAEGEALLGRVAQALPPLGNLRQGRAY